MRTFPAPVIFTLAVLISVQVASADDASVLKIVAQPGKAICQSASKQVGEAASKIDLCVTGGSFSHDVYALDIDKKSILKGIDDETTTGLSGTYLGEKVSLVCVPQKKAPKDVSPEKVSAMQKMMNISIEDARKMAIASETVEIGRLCTAKLENTKLIEVQVLFE